MVHDFPNPKQRSSSVARKTSPDQDIATSVFKSFCHVSGSHFSILKTSLPTIFILISSDQRILPTSFSLFFYRSNWYALKPKQSYCSAVVFVNIGTLRDNLPKRFFYTRRRATVVKEIFITNSLWIVTEHFKGLRFNKISM